MILDTVLGDGIFEKMLFELSRIGKYGRVGMRAPDQERMLSTKA